MKIIFLFVLCMYIYLYHVNADTKTVKQITINKNNFKQLRDILKDKVEDTILYFEDEYYNMKYLGHDVVDFYLKSNISFIGRKEGTIFDFRNSRDGALRIQFYNKGYDFTIENIIIENFKSDSGVFALQYLIYTVDFSVKIKNCTFRNNPFPLIAVVHSSPIKLEGEDIISIENCNF